MADQSMSPSAGLQNEGYAPASSQKRKREEGEPDDSGRAVRQHTTNGDPATTSSNPDPLLQERLLQAISQASQPNGVGNDDSARTAQAALATPMAPHAYPEPYDTQQHGLPPYGDDPSHSPSSAMMGNATYTLHTTREASTPSNQPKPAVGTPQWHQQRKDNHKEVERRRRETINDGINEIAKIIPGSEKNKGSILQRAVTHILQLQQSEKNYNNSNATLEAVVKEWQSRCVTLQEQLQQSRVECNKWEQRCRDAGLDFDDYQGAATRSTAGEEENPIPE